MDKKNKPSSTSIISAIVFIILLVGLAIYANNKNDAKNESSKKNTGSYTLKSNESITLGKTDSSVTFVEYYDYECPACQYLDKEVLPTLYKEYKNEVKFVFKQFPLQQHEQAKPAAFAAVCANDQGKFIEYNDLLVKNYENWTKKPSLLEDYAKNLKLNVDQFNSCRTSKQVADFVQRDYDDGIKDKLEATPTVYINGEKTEGVQELSFYRDKLNSLLNK